MKIDLIARPAQLQQAQLPLALQLSGRIADDVARRRIFLDYQEVGHRSQCQGAMSRRRRSLIWK